MAKVREDSIEELSLYRNLDTTVYLNDRQQVNRNIGSNQRTDYRDTQNCCGIGNHIRVLCDDINGTCSKGVAKTGPDDTQNPDNHIGRKEIIGPERIPVMQRNRRYLRQSAEW